MMDQRSLAVPHRQLIDTSFTASREFVIVRDCLTDNSVIIYIKLLALQWGI